MAKAAGRLDRESMRSRGELFSQVAAQWSGERGQSAQQNHASLARPSRGGHQRRNRPDPSLVGLIAATFEAGTGGTSAILR